MKEHEQLLVDVNRFGRLAEDFHAESDRGCAVLMVCMLEEALHDLFKAFVVDPGARIDNLAPRGRLSVAIETAVLVGLLSERQAKSFKALVLVRNKFAHGVLEGLTFDTPDIANLVRSAEPAIEYPGNLDANLNDPSIRTRFLMLAGIVWLLLKMTAAYTERRARVIDPDPSKIPPEAWPPGTQPA